MSIVLHTGLAIAAAVAALAASGCATSPPGRPAAARSALSGPPSLPPVAPSLPPVAPSPPPNDDGTSAAGGKAGVEHAGALEQLKSARLAWAIDRQASLRVLLPDASRWMRVTFWGMKSLVGFRYGKDHHAVVGAIVLPTADETAPGACGHAFEAWAQPYVDAFEVAVEHEPPRATTWNGKIADIDSLVAKTATLGVRDQYAVAYGAYPAWPGQCLILGVAVPAREELDRAKAVRDRFATDVLPKVIVTSKMVPKDAY